jgi:hypothetical protein
MNSKSGNVTIHAQHKMIILGELAKFDCIFKTFPRGIFVSVFSSSDLDIGFDYRSWSIQRLNDIWCFASHATVKAVPNLPIGSIG